MTTADQPVVVAAPPRAWPREALVLGLLLAVGVLRFFPALTAPAPLGDEAAYVGAFELARSGRSPYEHARYVYPPPLAHAGGWLLGHVGFGGVAALLRGLNLLGAVVLVATALRLTGWSRAVRAAAGALTLTLAPPVSSALQLGNLSAVVAGATALALLSWPRHPVAAGGLLATAIVLKPLAAPAALVLLGHRSARVGRRHLVAGGLGLLVGALAMSPWPREIFAMLRNAGALPAAESSVAMPRVLANLGLAVPAWAPQVIVPLLAILVARRRPLTPAGVTLLGCATVVLSAPLVWCHTFAFAVPILAVALAAACRSVAPPAPAAVDARRRAVLTLLGVCLAAIPVLTSDLWSLREWPGPLQAALGATPPLMLAALTWYALRRDPPRPS